MSLGVLLKSMAFQITISQSFFSSSDETLSDFLSSKPQSLRQLKWKDEIFNIVWGFLSYKFILYRYTVLYPKLMTFMLIYLFFPVWVSSESKTTSKQRRRSRFSSSTNILTKRSESSFKVDEKLAGYSKGLSSINAKFPQTNALRFDQLLNLVIDSTTEQLRDVDDPYRPSTESRNLGIPYANYHQLIIL